MKQMTTLASILLVDQDITARSLIAGELRGLGHEVSESGDAASAWAAVRKYCPDLMVCDYSLPDLNGVDLLTDVRCNEKLKNMRVMMTSDRGDSSDVVVALSSGADDFVEKPIHIPEFIARVDACLRRPANIERSTVVSASGISIDTVAQRVFVDGAAVTLAPREYQMLLFFLGNRDRVLTRAQLISQVWNRNVKLGPRTIDVHIRRLRSVLEPSGYDKYLQTVRGSGYRFSLSV
ncbi:MAG: response regulator transcription factor [Gammaproteobacteria bacterium]|nr:response regulator transcription factor [Gammaproteobacteria bacterium]